MPGLHVPRPTGASVPSKSVTAGRTIPSRPKFTLDTDNFFRHTAQDGNNLKYSCICLSLIGFLLIAFGLALVIIGSVVDIPDLIIVGSLLVVGGIVFYILLALNVCRPLCRFSTVDVKDNDINDELYIQVQGSTLNLGKNKDAISIIEDRTHGDSLDDVKSKDRQTETAGPSRENTTTAVANDILKDNDDTYILKGGIQSVKMHQIPSNGVNEHPAPHLHGSKADLAASRPPVIITQVSRTDLYSDTQSIRRIEPASPVTATDVYMGSRNTPDSVRRHSPDYTHDPSIQTPAVYNVSSSPPVTHRKRKRSGQISKEMGSHDSIQEPRDHGETVVFF